MKCRYMIRAVACLAVGLAATAALSDGTSKTVDDLSGLRPDTQGVETNAFWDTRAHLTYTVQVNNGAGTNAIDTAVLTLAASAPGDIGKPSGLSVIVR